MYFTALEFRNAVIARIRPFLLFHTQAFLGPLGGFLTAKSSPNKHITHQTQSSGQINFNTYKIWNLKYVVKTCSLI